VADSGQHGGALLDLAGDAVAHIEEGLARLADLAGAAWVELADVAARAEALRSPGESVIGRIWLRRKMMAMPSSATDTITIHKSRMPVLDENTRFSRVSSRNTTPFSTSTRIST